MIVVARGPVNRVDSAPSLVTTCIYVVYFDSTWVYLPENNRVYSALDGYIRYAIALPLEVIPNANEPSALGR